MLATPESPPHPREMVRLLSAPEGSLDWAKGMRYEIQVGARQPDADREYIGQCLRALVRSRGWRLLRTAQKSPFRSFLQFIQAPQPHGLGLTPGEVDAFLEARVGEGVTEHGQLTPSRTVNDNGASKGLSLVRRACLKLTPSERLELLRWLRNLES
jgi:hypothetical protein